MHKKTSTRSIPLAEKIKPHHVTRMTVHQGNEGARRVHQPPQSPREKDSSWPGDSSSWDGQSGATSASWPEEIEEVTTKKVLEQWEAVERTLYDEEDQLTSGPALNECIQWRTQLPHLRIVGRSPLVAVANSPVAVSRRNSVPEERDDEETIVEHNIPSEKSDDTPVNRSREEARKHVYSLLLEYVCAEIKRDYRESSLSEDLEAALRITPAPTCSAKNDRRNVKSGRQDDLADGQGSSGVVVGRTDEPRARLRREMATTSARRQGGTDDTTEDCFLIQKDRLYTPQCGRNKLGTVFNEKIVVSPVPFVVTTRESFSTLRTNPVTFMGQSLEFPTPRRSARTVNSGLKASSARRVALLRMPQVHSAWQAPVCPTVWPKNVRLAPIDVARFPSGRSRSPVNSAAPLRRSRNPLSPISRDATAVSPLALRENAIESLEIQGKHIVARSSRQNLLKPGWDSSPKIAKKTRKKKARGRSERN